MPLAKLIQDDFSAGGFPLADRELVPSNGFEDGKNALIDDDGLPVRRGGSSYKSNANFSTGARFLWDGYLAAGPRTVFASATKYGILNPADDATPVDLGADGVATPAKGAAIEGVLWMPNARIYAGSPDASFGGLGSVTVTNASATVTGTSFDTTVKPGYLFSVDGTHWYAVQSVDSPTSITLAVPFREATSVIIAGSVASSAPAPKVAGIYLAINNRMLACVDNRVYESTVGDPMDFPGDEYLELPGGVRCLGAEASRDVAIIFTTAGVWAISGTAFDLTDADGNPQQRLEQISRDLILWSWAGIATWGNSLVVPAVDGVWLLDAVGSPQKIIGGFETLYKSYVDAGYHTGFATVFNGHYYLPILDGSNAFVDLLVCRLVPTRRGQAFGWTRFNGHGAQMVGITVRAATAVARQPYLLGAHLTSGRICKLPYFQYDATTATDADGTAHVFEIVTREFFTGNLVKNLVKSIRARYELTDPSTVNPTLTCEWTEGDDAFAALTGSAPEADLTDDPYPWRVSKDRRAVHFRLRSVGAAAKLRLHSLEVWIRPSSRR